MDKRYHTLDSLFYDYDLNILTLDTVIVVVYRGKILYKGGFINCPVKYCNANLRGYLIGKKSLLVYLLNGVD